MDIHNSGCELGDWLSQREIKLLYVARDQEAFGLHDLQLGPSQLG